MQKWGWQPLTWLPVWALLKEGSATTTPPWTPCALTRRVTSVKFSLVQARCFGKIPHPAPEGSRLLSQALTNWIHLTLPVSLKVLQGSVSRNTFGFTLNLQSESFTSWSSLNQSWSFHKEQITHWTQIPPGFSFLLHLLHSLAGRRDWKLWRSKPHSLWAEFIKRSTSIDSVFLPWSPSFTLDSFFRNFKPEVNHY